MQQYSSTPHLRFSHSKINIHEYATLIYLVWGLSYVLLSSEDSKT